MLLPPPSDSTSFPGLHVLPQAADVIVGKNGAAVIHAVNRVLIPGDKFFK